MTNPQASSQIYPEQSQATLALVLGIVGVVACWILGPFAWWVGHNELKAIDAGRRAPESRSAANAGKILGIIGTVLLGLGVVAAFFVLLFLIPVATSFG